MLPQYGNQLQSPTSAFNEINALAVDLLNKKKKQINPVQVQAQVPYWMIKNSDGYGNSSLMINFLQSYYDWLTDYYGVTGANIFDLGALLDVSSTSPSLLPNFVNHYAPDIAGVFELTDDEQKPTNDSIRNTLVGIKTDLYQLKSTETAFRRLMSTLFSINPDTITIEYPGQKLMNLNDGLLNSAVFPNEIQWHPYAYVVKSEVVDENVYYEDVVRKTLHPAGMRGFFETVIIDGDVVDGDIDVINFNEVPLIANYYPYGLSSDFTLSKCTGCTSAYSEFRAGWTFPTHVYPDWEESISESNPVDFGSIKIYDFFTLEVKPGEFSPNDIIGTVCNYACGSSGSAGFNWYIGQDQQYLRNVYIETQTIEEPELSRNEDLSNKYN